MEEMMKALYTTKLGDPKTHTLGEVECRKIPVPEPGEREVRIKVAYASICGSDAGFLKGGLGPDEEMFQKSLPRRMGHEISGVIDKLGPGASEYGFNIGDRVTGYFMHFCNACHFCRTGREAFCTHADMHMDAMSEYVVWSVEQVYHLPDSVSLMDATLTEPLSVAIHACETARIGYGSRVAVFGGGGVGQLVCCVAKYKGASKVVLFEPVKEKRELALKVGADFAVDSLEENALERAKELTEGAGFECVIESSGAPSACEMALKVLATDGDAVYFASYPESYELKINLCEMMFHRQSHIHGMFNSSDGFEKAVRMIERVDVHPLIQRLYKLEEYDRAFKDQFSGKYAKIVFEINPQE